MPLSCILIARISIQKRNTMLASAKSNFRHLAGSQDHNLYILSSTL